MASKFWTKLKNGSDIRGTACATENNKEIDLTDEVSARIAAAFFYWLSKKTNKKSLKVAVGHDSRISAKRLSDSFIKGLADSGAKIYYTGLSSTPSMFMILKEDEYNIDGSVQITASHLPFDKNGFKFFVKSGGLDSNDITDILNIAENGYALKQSGGKVETVDYIDRYSEILRNFIIENTGSDKPLLNKHIIVDAGNGAGGFFAEKVLQPLGADTSGSQFLEPDGMFPNHVPNPEDKVAMLSICNQVKKVGADLGIIFDTDVDRAAIVDADGREINRNKLIALISAVLLEENPKSYIVTDSVTSDGLSEFIKLRGGLHHRFKRGYKNVINEAIRLGYEGKNCPLAIETSGHAAFKDNYFLDDGAYLVTKLLISMANLGKKNLSLPSLIADLKIPKEETEIRIGFKNNENFFAYGSEVLESLTEFVSTGDVTMTKDNYEGVRLNFGKSSGDGWLLIRQSLHDPILPINIESNKNGGSKKIAAWLCDFLKRFENLQLENLYKYIR